MLFVSPGLLRRSLLKAGMALLAVMFAYSALAATPAKKNAPWSELTPQQQQILNPLAGEWDSLDATRRAKWLDIAKRYPKMTPTGQKRVQNRMAAWVKLTPEERRKAREQYCKIGQLPPEKRDTVSQQWTEYQKLPDDVKKRLAAEQHKKADKIEPRKRKREAKAATPALAASPHPGEAEGAAVTAPAR